VGIAHLFYILCSKHQKNGFSPKKKSLIFFWAESYVNQSFKKKERKKVGRGVDNPGEISYISKCAVEGSKTQESALNLEKSIV
jgi:hypothetical protein